MNPKLYLPIAATLEKVVEETHNIKTFFLTPSSPLAFLAGQFVELTVPGVGEAPFTPSSSPAISDRLEITIMRAGTVTERLHALAPGARIGIRGPLGQPYPLDLFQGKEILIAGGGVGLAPLRALLFALFEDIGKYKKIIVRYGARSPEDIVYRQAVEKAWNKADALDVMTTVDKGNAFWTGHTGVVTSILDKNKLKINPAAAVAVVCGPPIMMKFTTLKLLEIGFDPDAIYLSMEKNMSCGVGKCGHCRLGPYYACKEGPVFTYRQIMDLPKIWE
ncbi:FAD/NAD(P)-binding protein [candidate division FCPU426 bacterium]|nr:FAD/NAD(P)-binding protein [candidate division FCPU426 bacterium]